MATKKEREAAAKRAAAEKAKATANGDLGERPDYVPEEEVDVPIEPSTFFPTIGIVQSLSPQKVKADKKYIEGAEEGELFIQGGDGDPQLFDGEEGIIFVVLGIKKYYSEYIPRKAGGGWVANYGSKVEAKENADPTNDLTSVVDVLCMVEDSETNPVVLRFDTVTKYRVGDQLAGFIKKFKTMLGMKYRVTALQTQNKAKQYYYTYDINPEAWVEKGEFQLMNKMVEEHGLGFSSSHMIEYDETSDEDTKY